MMNHNGTLSYHLVLNFFIDERIVILLPASNLLLLSRLCHYSVGGAWWHICFYESS
jgi:hypothetical protein